MESRIALSATADVEPGVELVQPLHDEHMGDVTLTHTSIITHHGTIPRFAANPTITAVRSGNWNDPTVWSGRRVPTTGDRVSIGQHMSVHYSSQSNAQIDSLEIAGSLTFSTNLNTRLVVANLTVLPSGSLTIGTENAPVDANVRAEVIVADKPLNSATDPEQYGTGLIALGRVTIHGAAIEATWTRLAAEPKAGDTSLLLEGDVSDWRPGDTIVLPDSRQVDASAWRQFTAGNIPPEWEELIVDRVEGSRVYLESPLQYDHLGARNIDGELELLPHVALLNRNVIVRSENPNGTRGHVMFTERADIDVAYARFKDLGRTDAFRDLDNTSFDAHGNVTHVGTNQIGRYSVHFHHAIGPMNPTNSGYQFKFVGNTIDGGRRWGLAVHGTSFGLVHKNVVYDVDGSAIVTEDGNEIGNVFSQNITIRVQGTHEDGKSGTAEGDYGRGGVGFWFRRGGNFVIGNVAADSTYAGFMIDGYFTGELAYPLFRGANPHMPGQGIMTSVGPSTLWGDNETYGMSMYGLWMTFPSGPPQATGSPPAYFYDLRIWHTHGTGIVAYYTARVTFNKLLILGDQDALDRNDTGGRGMHLSTYGNYDLVINNSRIEGYYHGILAPIEDASSEGVERPTIIRNTVLKNFINIAVTPALDGRSYGGNFLEVRNVKFEMIDLSAPNPIHSPANIKMVFSGAFIDWVAPSVVRVYDYNQVPGDNFQVYYLEQIASAIVPKTNPALLSSRDLAGEIGAPEAGLTNAEAWQRYGLAVAGAVAPANATLRSGILGLVAPISPPSTAPPRLVMVMPWANALVTSKFVRVRYNIIGQLPPGAKVYFQLDGGPLMSDLSGGLANVPVGRHTLAAFIGDADGNRLAGTATITTRFLSYH